MSNPRLVTSRIEIAASPAAVRAKFLDFAQLPVYSPHGFMQQIKAADPQKQIEKGDKLNCVVGGMPMSPIVLENSPQLFRWRGSVLGMINGDHGFRFLPSEEHPGGTTFVHEEEFSGPLSFITGEGVTARMLGMGDAKLKMQKHFKEFNEDFKRACEA
ncbi:hypothetical protein F5884DRAFT_764844 [Xylogone sp. PMI_703]|nr:hypothetical protein F5884DRAFT_764844 [Xylogone sp. PMI_703]